MHGTKAMKSQDRITGHVWASSPGVKVPMCVIGKPQIPGCYCIGKPQVPYISQENAWSDTITFRRCFFTVFFPSLHVTQVGLLCS